MDKYVEKIKNFKTQDIKSLFPFFILIIVLIIGKNLIGIVKNIFGGLNDATANVQETGQGAGVAQNEVIVEVESLSYPLNNYIMWADALEAAFYDTYLTEDDEAVGQVLKRMNNDMDISQLVKVYGVRDGGFWFNTDYNLPQAVNAMLDTEIKNSVNSNYAQKGITFRF